MKRVAQAGLASALVFSGWLAMAASPPATQLARIEAAYADFNDAQGAIALIDSGLSAHYAGKDRDAWVRVYAARRKDVTEGLTELSGRGLSTLDARAVKLMRDSVEAAAQAPESSAPNGKCGDAQRNDIDYAPLRQALYACFAELANNLQFEGSTVNRVAAFDLLARIEEPARRKKLFLAFEPHWQAINGAGEPHSPYRRMIRMASAHAKKEGSEIEVAAKTVGVAPVEIESWLMRILEAWRDVSGGTKLEPWDYRYWGGEAERELAQSIALDSMQSVNERYYADLGADLRQWNVLYDLQPRVGKAPLAYADYVRRGRMVDGVWQPTIVRVSANYARGGLGLLNELVHENGHAVHMMALRTRPAFMDLGDAVFFEAFADVPAWSTYEPRWQRKYLSKSASQSASLRALYSNVMLDVAWALFELRMLREPLQDPNLVWTDITHRYLHVVAHPELPWWAVRVQLVDQPGYMVNYGLGAVLTADIRARIKEQLGPFDTGDPRWHEWITQRLLRSGLERDTAALLRDFLGRPVSPQALLLDLRRIAPSTQ